MFHFLGNFSSSVLEHASLWFACIFLLRFCLGSVSSFWRHLLLGLSGSQPQHHMQEQDESTRGGPHSLRLQGGGCWCLEHRLPQTPSHGNALWSKWATSAARGGRKPENWGLLRVTALIRQLVREALGGQNKFTFLPTTRRLVLPWLRHLPSALPFQATLCAPSSPPPFTSFTRSLSSPPTEFAPVSLWPVLPLFSVLSPPLDMARLSRHRLKFNCLEFPLPLPLQIQFSGIPVPSWLDAAALKPVTLDLVIEFFVIRLQSRLNFKVSRAKPCIMHLCVPGA